MFSENHRLANTLREMSLAGGLAHEFKQVEQPVHQLLRGDDAVVCWDPDPGHRAENPYGIIDNLHEEISQGKLLLLAVQEGDLSSYAIDQALCRANQKYELDKDQLHLLWGSHFPWSRYDTDFNMHFLPLLLHDTYRHQQNSRFHDPSYNRKERLQQLYDGEKYFAAMCANRRPWRLWALYNLLHSPVSEKAQLSYHKNGDWGASYICPIMDEYMENLEPFSCEAEDNTSWQSPMTVSGVFHESVLFHVNLETHQHDGGTVFYTEKSAKPLLSQTPFLTWGEAGMNTTHFRDLGFEPYIDWFDLSFDTEPDPKKRWAGLQAEVERVCTMLDSMDMSQQIEWGTQNMQVLEHNKRQVEVLCAQQSIEICEALANLQD